MTNDADARRSASRRGGARRLGDRDLLVEQVAALRAEHHLVADHVGGRAGDRKLVGEVVGLGEDVVDLRILHRFAKASPQRQQFVTVKPLEFVKCNYLKF